MVQIIKKAVTMAFITLCMQSIFHDFLSSVDFSY